jgi:hypothetical protein
VKKNARRAELAGWLADPQNPWVGRNLANRAWGEMLGKPLAKSLDSPPAEELPAKLLDLLADEFSKNGSDIRVLVGAIALSRLYHAPAIAEGAKTIGYVSRGMDVDTLYASITQSTGFEPTRDPPEAPKEMPEFKVDRKQTDRDDGDPPVEELRDDAFADSRTQTLLNGEYIHDAIRAGVAAAIAARGVKITQASVDWLYLATLARYPNEIERTEGKKLIEASDRPRDGLEDILWTLLNSAEFASKR